MSTLRLAGFAGLLVAAALVGGTIIGSVAAATAPSMSVPDPVVAAPSAGTAASGERAAAACAAFRKAFATNLGVEESALVPAARAAAIATIDAAVAAGEMTKAVGDRLTARVESAATDGCALVAGRIAARAGTGRAPGSAGSAGSPGAAGALGVVKHGLTAAATALGVTPAELGAALRGGKTLKEIATARGVPYDAVSAAIVAAAKSDLDAAVAAGRIKAARADRILARLQANLADGRLRNPRPAAPAPATSPAAPGS